VAWRRDREDFFVGVGEFGERLSQEFGVGREGCGGGFAGALLEAAEAVELVRLFEGGRVALAFLRDDVEQHGLVLCLEKFKSAGEQRDIVPVDGP